MALAEDLWQQARLLIGDSAQRSQTYRGLQAEWQMQVLRSVSTALITTFDVNDLMNILAESLLQLGIPSAHLALYEAPQTYEYLQPAAEWSQLMLTYDQYSQIKSSPLKRRFLTHQLMPKEVLPHNRQYLMFVEPLYFRDRQFGIMLVEIGPSEGIIYEILRGEVSSALEVALLMREHQQSQAELQAAYTRVEKQVAERTAELQQEIAQREQLQQEIIESQNQVIQELSAPVIPVTEHIIVMPLIGSIDSKRARDITRTLLAGISQYRAKVVILDITGVPLIDSGVANHLNKTIQAAHLKGTQTIITGISEAVAETIVDLGIDWSGVRTLSDLQTGLHTALEWIEKQHSW
jgi:rsbT co-antagonist protein RsbR